jgi:1,4-alpha-glucan branching enzyme
MIAEESTAWPSVSRPLYLGGLGFGMKWNMGWMHDTLEYMSKDPVHRKNHHGQLTLSLSYAFSENFILSLSHDEVVHGKGSLLQRMPGDDWQKRANLRLLYGYFFTHPGKKLLFMGQEFGQWREWDHDRSLDWNLLKDEAHAQIQRWVSDLNDLYRREPALYELDFSPKGFRWIDCNNWEESVIIFERMGRSEKDVMVVACNFTPVPRNGYRIGVPADGDWKEILNSDAKEYGGSGIGNLGSVRAVSTPFHGMDHSISVVLPPLSVVIFKYDRK